MLSTLTKSARCGWRALRHYAQRLSTIILWGSAGVLLALTSAYGVLSYQRLSAETLQSAHAWSDAVARLVASNNTDALILNDIAAIESSLRHTALLPGILDIAVVRPDGKPLVQVSQAAMAPHSLVGGSARLLPHAAGSSPAAADRVESWTNISVGNSGLLARVRVQLSLQQRSAELQQEWQESMATALALVALLILCLRYIVHRALRPIRRLSHFAEQMPRQIGQQIPYSRACVEANQLERALNHASTQVASQLAQLEALSNTATEAILGLDADGSIRKANLAALDFFGVPLEQLLEQPVGHWIPGLEPPALARLFMADAGQRAPLRVVQHGYHALRQRRFRTDVALSIGRIVEVPALHYVCIVTDISGQLAAAELIVTRTEQLDAVFSLSPDGFVLFDQRDRLLFANPTFERISGLQGIDLPANTPLSVVWHQLTARCLPDEQCVALPAPTERGLDWRARLHLLRPQRRVIEAQLRRNRSDRPTSVLCLRDITHEEAVERMKSEFLATAAHELRTPIVSIFGFTDLLLRREFNSEQRAELLATVHQHAGRLSKLVNELVDLARLEARQGLDFTLESVALATLLGATLQEFSSLHPQAAVTLSTVADVKVLIDPAKLQHALMHLLENARNFSPNGAPILVSTSLATLEYQPYVTIIIADHGIGMNPEQLARAFERFYRADDSGAHPGTGLGLSLVKEIAELHHGKIELHSDGPGGTRAALWLPLSTD
ncbi:MAG: ATP-binding protein [Sphingomonadaceae bacterium]